MRSLNKLTGDSTQRGRKPGECRFVCTIAGSGVTDTRPAATIAVSQVNFHPSLCAGQFAMQTQPFQIAIADQDIDDLRQRIRATRWAPATPSPAWQQGTDTVWLRELADYWAGHFDWRAAERDLNRQPQFLADVNGQRVHFVHRRGAGPAPYPLVITHGWPGS